MPTLSLSPGTVGPSGFPDATVGGTPGERYRLHLDSQKSPFTTLKLPASGTSIVGVEDGGSTTVGQHTVTLKSMNGATVAGPVSYTVATTPVPPEPPADQPPVISAVAVDVTETSSRFRWHVSELSTGTVYYRQKGATTWTKRLPEQTTPDYQDHDQTLTGLASATEFEFYLESKDTAGQAAKTLAAPFKTTGTVTVPPIPPEPPTGAFVDLPAGIDSSGSSDVGNALLAFFATVPPKTWIRYKPGGQYRVESTMSLPSGRTGLYIDFQGARQFRTVEPAGSGVSMWRLNRATDCRFTNGTLFGASKAPGVYQQGFEWQHAFEVNGGADLDFGNLVLDSFTGDGVYFTDSNGRPVRCRVHDSTIKLSGRCAVAIICGQDIQLDHLTMIDTGMVDVDLEPNGLSQQIDRVTLEDSSVSGHKRQAFGIGGPGAISNVMFRRLDATGQPWGLYTGGIPGPRKTNISFLDSKGTTNTTYSQGAVMYFRDTDGLHVHGITHNLQGTSDTLVTAPGCTGIDVSGNTVTGGRELK